MTSKLTSQFSKFSPSQILGLDIFPDKIRFHKVLPDNAVHEKICRSSFPLLPQVPSKTEGTTCSLHADAKTALSIFFQCDTESRFSENSQALIILGFTHDPFSFSSRGQSSVLTRTLQTLEFLGTHTKANILIRTRSPLLLLGVPLLKNLTARLSVTLAAELVETPSRHLLRALPLQNRTLLQEIIPITRALTALGIHAELQIAPLIERQRRSSWAKAIAASLANDDFPIKLLPIINLLSERFRARVESLVANDAHRTLFNELQLLLEEPEELQENAA